MARTEIAGVDDAAFARGGVDVALFIQTVRNIITHDGDDLGDDGDMLYNAIERVFDALNEIEMATPVRELGSHYATCVQIVGDLIERIGAEVADPSTREGAKRLFNESLGVFNARISFYRDRASVLGDIREMRNRVDTMRTEIEKMRDTVSRMSDEIAELNSRRKAPVEDNRE